ncbi:HpcH/HpaI aldolase/citrate lyase family protein [Polynucleobacter asymbioticus]|jgi:citrate lyase subunit beta/citryl-CoA lyase|uniref:Malyl-CoA thiolesterase n=1 Tax=Polynucleobacter asymbioticus TaxID=576611 RepID=A0AAC9NH76_9BURK|nr:CoA ester lyase [Polynucleobacter asymbioticus]APB98432.1 malyl-CoA thiolesterase [Polynucleobacter asymbioticus]APC00716.1 malyl-CoA thiolesterase [Polynucleobacter asymbioticus]
MINISRPRRSVLYMPGANTRALEKAKTLPADSLILDLEDAVAPDSKNIARVNIRTALESGFGHREAVVRMNGLNTPWGLDDLKAFANTKADAIVLPKVESAKQIQEVAKLLSELNAPEDLTIWAMIETPKAIFKLEEIASAHPRLEALVLGTSDLVKDLHARHTLDRTETLTALSLSVLAARAYGLCVLDGVHLTLDDESGLRQSCIQGRDMGFDGKTLIHPSQIALANELFGPSPQEIEEAQQKIAAYETAISTGAGIAVLNGKLIEELHIQDAKRLIALAAAIQSFGTNN